MGCEYDWVTWGYYVHSTIVQAAAALVAVLLTGTIFLRQRAESEARYAEQSLREYLAMIRQSSHDFLPKWAHWDREELDRFLGKESMKYGGIENEGGELTTLDIRTKDAVYTMLAYSVQQRYAEKQIERLRKYYVWPVLLTIVSAAISTALLLLINTKYCSSLFVLQTGIAVLIFLAGLVATAISAIRIITSD